MSDAHPRNSIPGQIIPAPVSGRPSVIQLVFREKGALYAAYIPLFAEGGLFVPTNRDYRLGDDIYLLLEHGDEAIEAQVDAFRVDGLEPREPAIERRSSLRSRRLRHARCGAQAAVDGMGCEQSFARSAAI